MFPLCSNGLTSLPSNAIGTVILYLKIIIMAHNYTHGENSDTNKNIKSAPVNTNNNIIFCVKYNVIIM